MQPSQTDRSFLLGFIAGEGCFMIKTRPAEHRRRNLSISPEFTIYVTEREVLENLRDRFAVGTVAEHGDGVSWKVRDIDGCRYIADLIEDHTSDLFRSTNKYQQFEKWERALSMIEEGEHSTKEGARALVDISYEIGRPDARAHTKKELMELIDESGDYICGEPTNDGTPCQRHVAKPENTCQHH